MFLHLKITLENYAHPSQSQGSPGLSPKVINGAKAGFGQFPWHVSLSTKKNLHWFMCGGSMISNSVVLTAAHCLYRYTILGSTFYLSMKLFTHSITVERARFLDLVLSVLIRL